MTAERHDASRGRSWNFRAGLALALLVLLLVGYFVGVALVPREWARFIGNRVDGRLWAGTTYGLLLGFVCTVLSLAVLRQAFRPMSWAMRGVILVLWAAVSVPNLMTLGIVVGDGKAAHAGERILDVDGPGFRAATALGTGAAVVVMLAVLAFRWQVRDRGPSKELRAAREAAPED